MGFVLSLLQDQFGHGRGAGETQRVCPDLSTRGEAVEVLHGVKVPVRPHVGGEVTGGERRQTAPALAAPSPYPASHDAEEPVIRGVEAEDPAGVSVVVEPEKHGPGGDGSHGSAEGAESPEELPAAPSVGLRFILAGMVERGEGRVHPCDLQDE